MLFCNGEREKPPHQTSIPPASRCSRAACREAGVFMRSKSRKLQRLRRPAGEGEAHLRRFLALRPIRRGVAPLK